MKPPPRKVWIRVPASTSNLGPGYDVLGLALKYYNEIELKLEPRRKGQSALAIDIQGEGATSLPRNENNFVWKSMLKVFRRTRFPVQKYSFRFNFLNRIPLARGLGSSAAACLGGILAASSVSASSLSQEEIIRMGIELEGHPDNLVPALVGGICVCSTGSTGTNFIRLTPPKDLAGVIAIPEFELETKKARSVLPRQVPHQDAVFNVSRVALFLAALLSRDYSFFKTAMEDRLHQPYRKKLVPGYDEVLKRAYSAGALGAALSGAGPSVFAFAPKAKARQVGQEMQKGFAKCGHKAIALIADFSANGAEVKGMEK